MKCITRTSVTGELLYYYKKTVSTFKEVQLVQMQHDGADVPEKQINSDVELWYADEGMHESFRQRFWFSPDCRVRIVSMCVNCTTAQTMSPYTAWMCTPGRCSWASFTDRLRPLRFNIHYWYLRVFSSDGFPYTEKSERLATPVLVLRSV